MSNKDPRPYDLPKETVDAAKKQWEQRMQEDPALKRLFEEATKPPTEQEQKMADEIVKEGLKKLNKGS